MLLYSSLSTLTQQHFFWEQQGPLNCASVKAFLIRLITQAELASTTTNSPTLRDLFEPFNTAAVNMMVKSTAIADLIMAHFCAIQNKTKSIFSLLDDISMNINMWISTNVKSTFGITAHWINEHYCPCEAIIVVKKVVVSHTGVNLSNHLFEVLKRYYLVNKLFSSTANNTSNNSTMAIWLEFLVPQFLTNKNILGCLVHLVNLVPWSGMAVLSKKLGHTGPPFPNYLNNLIKPCRSSRSNGHSSQDWLDHQAIQIKNSSERARNRSFMASGTCGIMKLLYWFTGIAIH